MKKVIIFDFDGVLFDTTGIATEDMMKVYPTLTVEIMKELYCGSFIDGMEKYNLTANKVPETEEEMEARYIAYAAKKAKAPMFDGTKELLVDLHKAGYLLVINTSAYERMCLPLLEAAGISHLFDLVAAAELSRSKVEKFKLINEKFSASKQETVFITDTVGDIREAEIAGIPTIAVTWGAHDRFYFEREKYKCLVGIVDTVEELRKWILKS